MIFDVDLYIDIYIIDMPLSLSVPLFQLLSDISLSFSVPSGGYVPPVDVLSLSGDMPMSMSGQEAFGQVQEQAGQGGEEYLDKEPDKLPGEGQEDDKDIG